MQHQNSHIRTVALGPASLAVCLTLMAAIPEILGAQPISLASPERVKGAPRMIELRNEPTSDEVKAARTAYQQGHIVRLSNASDEMIHRIAKGAVTVKHKEPDLSKKPADGRAVKMLRTEIGERSTAFRIDKRGVLHQITTEIAKDTPPEVRAKVEAGYREWEAKQSLADTPSQPDQGYWTPMLSKVYQTADSWGTTQAVVRVWRLNENDNSGDYYMVITDPTVTPNVKTDVAASCFDGSLRECGWFTSSRDIQISTSPAGILLDHGPNTPITTTTATWTLGGTLSIPPGINGAYLESWNQDSVTTADQSSTQNGVAHWVESFQGLQPFKVLPATSVGVFVSHQGALFKMPDNANFTLNVGIGTNLLYLNMDWNAWYTNAGSSVSLSANISPPELSLTQNSTTIAPGGNGSMQVFADILGGDTGLDWVISNVPNWASVSQLKGVGTTTVAIQVAPDTPLGTTGTLNIDTEHEYASPSVVKGPLKFQIKVGKPDLHGALLIGGAHFQSGSYDALGSGLFYSAATNDFVASAAMNQARSYHTSTPLQDGTILVAGGRDSSDPKSALASAEIYDPSTASFIPLANSDCPGSRGCMITPAWNRAATRLADGRVLITGGTSDGETCTAAAEVYDPSTKTFSAVGNMAKARCAHAMGLAPTKVLVAGGFTKYSYTDAETAGWEVFNPATGQFHPPPSYNPDPAGYERSATPTSNGVLLSGGFTGHPGQAQISNLVQVYDEWGEGALEEIQMSIPRSNHTATRLQDGRVLITGGRSLNKTGEPYTAATAEILDLNRFTITLLSGAGTTCPGASGCMLAPRAYHTATLLLDGRVLLSGGVGEDLGAALKTTEIFDPKTNTFSAGPPFDGRVSHTAVQLRAPSSVTLLDPGPQTSEQPFTIKASVNVDYPNELSGSVEFSSETVQLGSAPIVSGVAGINVKLPAGKHPIIAKFGGSNSIAPSASEPLVLIVNTTPTSMTLTSDSPTSTVGQKVTFSATLTANGPTPPSGTVRFFDAGTELGSVPVTAPQVQFATSTLSAGTHMINAVYSGDPNYQPDNSNSLTQTVNGMQTQVKLVSSSNPVAFGAPVTFTATVTPTSGQGVPTGEVVYIDGANQLAVVTLVNGTAPYTTSSLAQGDHKITANYRGDKTFTGGISNVLTQTVGATATTTTLSAPKNPVVYGQDPVTLAVTVTGTADTKPAGAVSLLEGTTPLGNATLDANGSASITVMSGLPAGIHQLSASYAGSPNFTASNSQTFTLTVDHAATTTALEASPASPTVGQAVTLTARVQGPGSKQTGTVTFLDGSKTVGAAQLNAGSAVVSVNNLTLGSHSLTAVYGGDVNYSSSTSSATAVTVQGAASAVKLESSTNPASLSDTIILTATVTGTGGTPTGKVAFSRGGVQAALLDLVGGKASFTVPKLTPGTYSFSAAYQGDDKFGASTSNNLAQVINPADARISVDSNPNPSSSKSPVTFTATVQGLSGFPLSGSVTFLDGATSLGVAAIDSNGKAALTTSTLSVGSHSITVSWAGDDNYGAATSPILTQVVNSNVSPSVTTLTSSKNPSAAGETVSFVVRVQGQSAGPNTPTGTVTLTEGATTLGAAALNNGSATIPVANLSVNSHVISASYGGDNNFGPSTSPAITQTVNAAPTSTIVLTSQTNPSIVSATVSLVATVKSASGTPSGMVSFRDGGTVLGTVALANGVATLPVASLSVGTHNLVANYAGDGTYPAAASAPYAQKVNQASSNVLLTPSQNPSSLNQSVTFRAVVTTLYKNPTGTVTFLDGSTTLGTSPLTSGVATYTTSALSAGSHNITAKYSGDTNVSASTSPVVTEVVNAQFPVKVVVTSTPNPSADKQTVTFTITVTSTGGGTPTGNVTLSETIGANSITYGNAFLTNGSAMITLNNLSPGSHVMYGTYGSDATHTGGTSEAYTQVVNQSTTGN